MDGQASGADSRPIAALLAGGAGSRLGGGKAMAVLGGRPLIGYPLAALREAEIETVVVAKQASELPPLDVPIWREPDEPTHPLLGIVTALRGARRPLIVCACDMPFVPAALLVDLAQRNAPLVIPSLGGRLHPLLGRYDPLLLDRLEQALAERLALQRTVEELDPLLVEAPELERFGDPERLLFNVNGPEDLARAEQML